MKKFENLNDPAKEHWLVLVLVICQSLLQSNTAVILHDSKNLMLS